MGESMERIKEFKQNRDIVKEREEGRGNGVIKSRGGGETVWEGYNG
jgi:hypothetical protein